MIDEIDEKDVKLSKRRSQSGKNQLDVKLEALTMQSNSLTVLEFSTNEWKLL